MSWLPRIRRTGWTGCDDAGEVEGSSLSIEWFGLYLEIVVGRRERGR